MTVSQDTVTTRDTHLTDSVLNARDDARAQGSQTSEWMPYLPASTSPYCPAGVDPAALTWAETVAPGGYTHKVLARGSRLRFDDPTGDACANLVLFNALRTGRAVECGRHAEDPVAGVPRPQPSAVLR